MARFLLTIGYLGTQYAGWQRQKNAIAVQGVIEGALAAMCQRPVSIVGAGRTDAGVHARGQRAHADIPIEISPEGLVLGLNTLLPRDVRISAAEIVADDFHARYDATEKTYVYRIWNDKFADVFASPTHTLVQYPLEVTLMQEAAASLAGRHDFRAFTVTRPGVDTTIREVRELSLRRAGRTVEITARADGFLRYMVRRIAGLLIEIGGNRVPVSDAGSFLEPVFQTARWTAPPEGLTLEHVAYDEPTSANMRPRRT